LSTLAIIAVACYDEFDPASYQPVFSISGYTASEEIQQEALVAYWPFDGNLTETVSGVEAENSQTTFVNGFKGQAAGFNGNNPSYLLVEPSEAIIGLESFTLSFWVNATFVDADANGSNDGILGLFALSNPTRFWGNLEWFVENDSKETGARLKVIVAHNSELETDVLVENVQGFFDAWTNHTLTYDATTSTLTYYVNGSPRVSKTTPWTGPVQFVNSGPIVMGTAQFQTTPSLTNHGPEPWASHFTGSIDEVRIYNTALTAEEINALTVLQGKGK